LKSAKGSSQLNQPANSTADSTAQLDSKSFIIDLKFINAIKRIHNGHFYCIFIHMVDRLIYRKIQDSDRSILLLGPRQTGKSTLLNTLNPDLTINVLAWRDDVANHSYDPSDSAGYYWVNLSMDVYSDKEHILERYSTGGFGYNRSPAFWQASAAVNLPSKITNSHYAGLNGFDSRCCAYGYALGLLTELKFPDSKGKYILDFPGSGSFPYRREE
jgi:hypothetical protein